MRKYWLKIVFGALLIFAVGYGLVSGVRHVASTIISSKGVTIPLGSFVPFKLDGAQVGTLSQLVIRRSSPKVISGFDLRIRLTDSAAFNRLQSCHLSVSNPNNFDERTTFICLASDSGFQAYGTIHAELRDGDSSRDLESTLLLPDGFVRDLQRHAADGSAGPAADSLAAAVEERVRAQARGVRDSVKAAALDQAAARMKERADSLRHRSAQSKHPAAADSKPAKP